MDLQERVLKHVVDGLPIAKHSVQKPNEMIVMTVDEDAKSAVVPLSIGVEKGLVRLRVVRVWQREGRSLNVPGRIPCRRVQ